MKILCILSLLLFGSIFDLKAQSYPIEYTYDSAGNMTLRMTCSGDCSLVSNNKSGEELAKQFDDRLVMYPNPTTGILNITWDSLQSENIQSITLTNLLGNNLQTYTIGQTLGVTANLGSYPSGVYLAIFRFKDNSTFSQKIIKE